MTTRFGAFAQNATLATMLALALAACNKAPDAPVPVTTIGTEIDDSVITVKVKAALLADADVKAYDFKIETHKGVVQLSGFVDSQAQVERAATIARSEMGVKNIENNVTLKGAPTSVGNKIDYGVVTTRIKSALLMDERIKSIDIAVVTRQGEVQLSGFVDNQSQMDRALAIARNIEGARLVTNQMNIKK